MIELEIKKYREENPEIVTAFRTNYKNIKKEKDKASSKRISDENSLLSLNDLYLKTPTKYCHSCKIVKQTVEFSRRNCRIVEHVNVKKITKITIKIGKNKIGG